MFRLRKRSMVAALAATTLAITGGVAVAAPIVTDDAPAATPAELAEEAGREATRLLQTRTFAINQVKPQEARARQIAAVQAAFAAFTMDGDMRGVEESRYTGTYFRPDLEERRKCIVKRESEGHYDVVSSGGGYFGAYQMSPELGRGATWMMLPEHKDLLGPERAKDLLAELRERPVNKWPRYWQDAAFSTVHNWEGTGSGASHWRGGRWSC